MSKERTLSFSKSKQLSIEDADSISGAGWTSYISGCVTYSNQGGQSAWDPSVDATYDF